MPSICILGSVNADIVLHINKLPSLGETLDAARPDTGFFVPGGKGANQAVACAKLASHEMRAEMVCRFGNDSHGEKLQSALTSYGVGTSGSSRCADTPSGQAYIFLHPGGNNSILLVGGANREWPSVLSAEVRAMIEAASMVLLQREVPERVNVEAAVFARSVGTPVMMDAGGMDEPIPDSLLAQLAYFCPNETELARITGMSVDGACDAEVLAAARELQRRGVANILVTLGTDGSLFVGADGVVERAAAFRIAKADVVDTTGAGDCYRGAFAVALTSLDLSLAGALQFAAAASALCVQRLGAMPSMPARHEVIEFLAARGVVVSTAATSAL